MPRASAAAPARAGRNRRRGAGGRSACRRRRVHRLDRCRDAHPPHARAARTTVPLIAETGGQNAMIVDSSALAEQVVADVVGSAFDSAGQRCSALRVLCVQEEIADRVLAMLAGAMRELDVGDPVRLRHRRRADHRRAGAGVAGGAHRAHATRGDAGRGARRWTPRPQRAGTSSPPWRSRSDRCRRCAREVFGPVLHVVALRRRRARRAGRCAQCHRLRR